MSMILRLLLIPESFLPDLPVSQELISEAYRDLMVELRAERMVLRVLLWVIVVWLASFPLDKIIRAIGSLRRGKKDWPHP